MIDVQTPKERALASFAGAFPHVPEIVASAPGRINIIGEHTDYNDGFVLPAALTLHTVVVGARCADRNISVIASDFGDACDAFSLEAPITKVSEQRWKNHVRGMINEMLAHYPHMGGFSIAIAGNIPKSSGLSSSASLAVAVGAAICAIEGLAFDPVVIARTAQASECRFVGTQCGIMDQLSSAHGQINHGLLIDCRDLAITPVRLPDHVAMLIVHSGVERELSETRYNDRRSECEAAAEFLDVSSLRDISLDQLLKARNGMDVSLFSRARHVVTENARTLAASAALASGDLERLGLLINASHASLRDDFAVSHPYVDRLVAIAQNVVGTEGGARMSGGGFGGAILMLLARNRIAEVSEQIATKYRDPQGRRPVIIVGDAGAGASVERISPL
jgi:galactokinase